MMDIKAKIEKVVDPEPGQQLEKTRRALGMARDEAAHKLGLSTLRLWMLEVGEADMERPEMWERAHAILRGVILPTGRA